MSSTTVPANPIVFFIHGLNTFGDDLIHVGPLNFGPMVQAWRPPLEDIGCEVYALNEMGFGPLDEQVERAMRQIHRILPRKEGPVHLLGHSMGGLVARGVAKRMATEFPKRVRTVITFGTPHFGARVADRAFTFHDRSPRLYRFMKLIGYDSKMKIDHVRPLKFEVIEEFNLRHPLQSEIDNVSLVGVAPREHIGYQYRAIHKDLHETPDEASDGLIMSASQRWGRVAGEYRLDHIAQLGSLGLLPLSSRKSARKEFARAVKTVQDIIKTNSQP